MNISSTVGANQNAKTYMANDNASDNAKLRVSEAHSKNIKTEFTEKISKDDAADIRAQITQNANDMMLKSTTVQASVVNNDFSKDYDAFQSFLSNIGYEGKPIAELSQDEAAKLVSKDGLFGVDQTSERIANFVIDGAGGNENLLRAGREGMLQGFKEAEAMWGDKLPEISQQTMAKATQMVDMAMNDLGFSLLNQEV